MDRHTKEVVLALLEDAEAIDAITKSIRPTPSAIRMTISPILRRWFVDQNLHLLERHLKPKKIQFEYCSGAFPQNEISKGKVGFWFGNFAFNDIVVVGMGGGSTGGSRSSGKQTRRIREPLGAFLGQKVCHIANKTFTRREILKLIANNLGGAHMDLGKLDTKPEMRRLREAVGYEVDSLGNIKMLLGAQISEAKSEIAKRGTVFDLPDLVALDAAKVLSLAIKENQELFESLLV